MNLNRKIFITAALLLIALMLLNSFQMNNQITEKIREFSRYGGWYEGRRSLQLILIGGLLIFGLMALIILERNIGNIWQYYSKAFYGIIFLAGFTVITMISYHPIDYLYLQEIAGIKCGRIGEFIILMWIILFLLAGIVRSADRCGDIEEIEFKTGSRYL